jgi:hypothetical protein
MQNETKKVYSKPEVAEIGKLTTFVNMNNESFTADGGAVIIPGFGKFLLTVKS